MAKTAHLGLENRLFIPFWIRQRYINKKKTPQLPCSQKMHETHPKKPRGRAAIQAAHGGVTSEDEARLDLMISDLYGVDDDEAAEIHLNYHLDRLIAALVRRCTEKGIRPDTIADQIRYLNVSGAADQVAKGKLSEAAAVDALFRTLIAMENQGKDDRYISFYG